MPTECGLPHDHDKHFPILEGGVVIKCDGDSSKRENYDGSYANKPSANG